MTPFSWFLLIAAVVGAIALADSFGIGGLLAVAAVFAVVFLIGRYAFGSE